MPLLPWASMFPVKQVGVCPPLRSPINTAAGTGCLQWAHHFSVYEQLNCTRTPCIFISPPNDLGGWGGYKELTSWLIGKVITFLQRPKVQCISPPLPLPRPENNWLCPCRAPLELNVICKGHNCLKRQSLLFVFLRL